MPQTTKLGDIGQGVCYSHKSPRSYTTTLVTGANSVTTNNLATGIVGSIGNATCGHPTTALTGSPNVFCENMQTHRVGDVGRNGGPYVMVSGSPNVFANN